MIKIVKYAIIVNIILGLVFVYSNLSLWSQINGNSTSLIISSSWNPFTVSAMHYSYLNGVFSAVQTIFFYYNIPFWLFFVAIAVNLYFIVKLGKRNK